MDRSGYRKRKAPESSSSTRLVLEPGWLSLDMATPYRCHICLRAFTSQHARVGHYNAHRSKRLVHGPEWQSQILAAQLKAIWQRQSLLLWGPMVQRLPPVPMARPSPLTRGRQNPLILHDRGESYYAQEASRKQKMVYAPGASSSTPRPREVQTEKKRKVVHIDPVLPVRAPGASRLGPLRMSSKAETLDLELRL